MAVKQNNQPTNQPNKEIKTTPPDEPGVTQDQYLSGS